MPLGYGNARVFATLALFDFCVAAGQLHHLATVGRVVIVAVVLNFRIDVLVVFAKDQNDDIRFLGHHRHRLPS